MKLNLKTSSLRTILALILTSAVFVPSIVISTPVYASEQKTTFGLDLSSTQWALTAVRAQEAWAVTQGEGVTVAVLDTGVDGTHPDLVGRVLPGWSSLDNTPLAADKDNDADQHGTHVATIIGGDNDGDGVTGLAPKVTILPVQVLGSNGGSDRTVAAGIDWAVANGADVINLSLGGAKSIFDNGGNVSCTAVGRAFDAGVVVIVAAGNSGSARNPENRPASCRGALSVAALDENLERTFFSSFDATVGIAAPGRRIVAGVPTSSEIPYAQWDGTSMAAPLVAAAAALLRAANPNWTATQVVDALKASAIDINSPGFDPETGSGALDAAAALDLPKKTVGEVKSSIIAVTVPRILSAQAGSEKTILRWEAPIGAAVESYRIDYYSELKAKSIESIIAGDKLTGSVAVDAFMSGFLTITAITKAGERTSMPFNSIEMLVETLPIVPQPKVTKLTARWVTKGIELTITTDGPSGTVNATALDWNYGLLGNVDIKVKSGKVTTVLLFDVAGSSESRAHIAVISAGVEGNRKRIDLTPQYPLSGLILTSGPNKVAVRGSSNFICLMEQIACAGTIVELRDSKTRKILGSTRVLENLEFTIIVNRAAITSGKVVFTLNGKNSSPALPIIAYKPTSNDKKIEVKQDGDSNPPPSNATEKMKSKNVYNTITADQAEKIIETFNYFKTNTPTEKSEMTGNH